MALLLITHDLAVVSEVADRVAVMYAGKIVEEGSANEILSSPRHPYTYALLRSLPRLRDKKGRLQVIRGNVPNPLDYPSGCRFHPRCWMAKKICGEREPILSELAGNRKTACHFAEEM